MSNNPGSSPVALFKFPFQCDHWHPEQTPNPNGGNVASSGRFVGSVAPKVEVAFPGFGNGECFAVHLLPARTLS